MKRLHCSCFVIAVACIVGAMMAGPRAACGQNTGACCHYDGHCTMVTSPTNCPADSAIFLGGCVSCDVWSCLAACCHNDGSCNVLSLAACWATGDGNPLGYGVCEPKTPCPFAIGPCCLTNGTCTVTTRAQCDGTGGLDGVWQGTGVTCSGSACPPPRGACCVISQCTYTTQFLCGDRTWAGANTSCNPSARACCLADINRSNSVSVQDIFDFLAKYFEPNMAADFNRSCFLSVQDLFEFLAAYFTGCE